MRLLAVDIGAGTQDILLLDTGQPVENAVQLVLPSPTVLVAQRIKAATARGEALLLTGDIMGGGPCTWALREHLKAGFPAYATPGAALTFHDDLDEVASWGVRLVSPDEVVPLHGGAVIRTGDIDLNVLGKALAGWGIRLDPAVIAVAVLDHGVAPRGQSQRLFRFQHLEGRLRENGTLEAFVFTPDGLPGYLTRMQAVVRRVGGEAPLVLADTAAAAALGALLDPVVAGHPHRLVVNLGNSHTMAFNLAGSRVLGLFEHHTGALSLARLETLLARLVSGELGFDEVWGEGGHGSLVLEKGDRPLVTVTGPRRRLLAASSRQPYLAAPFGSMMLAGCFGLARAAAVKLPRWRDEIEAAFRDGSG